VIQVGAHVQPRLPRYESHRQGDDVIRYAYRYTVLVVEDNRIGLDDGDPQTRWPIELFKEAS
jgi:hypothetical protein